MRIDELVRDDYSGNIYEVGREFLFRNIYEIWQDIEGQFGTAVGSFFVFSRYVFLLNLLSVVLWTCFVAIPMSIAFDYTSLTRVFVFKNVFDGTGIFQVRPIMTSHIDCEI